MTETNMRTPEFAQRVLARACDLIAAEDPSMVDELTQIEQATILAGVMAGMSATVDLIEEAARG